MHTNIISDTNRRIPRKRIKELIGLIEEEEDPPDSALNIIFIRNKKIAGLNKKFRSIQGPTDVLSFNIDELPGEDSIFGEIYISTDLAAKNAAAQGIGFYDELFRLCCHGFLHLLGYNHDEEKDRTIMQAREDHFLGRLHRC